jgi:purine-nucleoside phosphorylase
MVVVAAVREELGDLPGEVVGVGAVRAANAAATLLATRRPSSVVLVGTAGRYAGGPPIGAVVQAARLGWVDGAAALGRGYVPLPPEPLVADVALRSALGLPEAHVLTTGAVTTDLELAARLGASWGVEHLEAYAVALACERAGVRFAAVFAITNDVGPDAHAQWLAHRHAAQDSALRAVAALRTFPDRSPR